MKKVLFAVALVMGLGSSVAFANNMASDVEIVAMVNEFKPIDIKELPQAVQDAIKENYSEATIKEAAVEVAEDGTKKTPVVLHRAILGSLDRFMAYILEETKGNLPLWLAPTQVKVLPVKNEYHLDYAQEIYQLLLDEGFEVELDSRDEKLGYRIREAQMQKANYILVLGNNERDERTVTYRKHGEQKATTVTIDEFVSMLKQQIKDKK